MKKTYSIIFKENLGNPLLSERELWTEDETYEFFEGDIQQRYLDIRNNELRSDKLYDGHIIINNPEGITADLIKGITDINVLTPNNIFFNGVLHHGVDSLCQVDDSIVYCSSWVLPIVLHNYRVGNPLYGELAAKRIELNRLKVYRMDISTNIDLSVIE